jgi:hypothetical protein
MGSNGRSAEWLHQMSRLAAARTTPVTTLCVDPFVQPDGHEDAVEIIAVTLGADTVAPCATTMAAKVDMMALKNRIISSCVCILATDFPPLPCYKHGGNRGMIHA